jgi:hypothetical protein
VQRTRIAGNRSPATSGEVVARVVEPIKATEEYYSDQTCCACTWA